MTEQFSAGSFPSILEVANKLNELIFDFNRLEESFSGPVKVANREEAVQSDLDAMALCKRLARMPLDRDCVVEFWYCVEEAKRITKTHK